MAIQLNERDHLIFKLIAEHQVLLEKHISYFISDDDKPVLIRDRLRKLFYLDYLLCHRHGSKLPWWTTPTKPLVYMLSPTTAELIGNECFDLDLFDADVQRHLLEVANLRMLFHVSQHEGSLSEFAWSTLTSSRTAQHIVDAVATFKQDGVTHRVALVNHPQIDKTRFIEGLRTALDREGVSMVWVVSRDEAHQLALMQIVSESGDLTLRRSTAFSTHHELYKTGVVKTRWQQADQMTFVPIATALSDSLSWASNLPRAQAVSA